MGLVWGGEARSLILFKITNPDDGSVVYTAEGKTEDKFVFVVPNVSQLSFCFVNRGLMPEEVSFAVHIGHPVSSAEVARREHLDPLQAQISRINSALQTVVAEQRYMRAREARHRKTNESTSQRVMLYTAVEAVALISVSVSQVMYLRNLFNRRAGGRV
eukprot:jgi/Mesvir1/13916/Mv16038-RA.1